MKANELSCKELMVGDWVIFYDSGYASDGTTWEENRVCKIDSIDGDVRVKWYDESGCEEDWPHVSTVFLSPILLTQEILEKNGWKWNEYHTMLNLVVGTIHVGWGFYKDCLSISDHSHDGNCQISSLKCIYVHQLQHTLRLCGIEKEIIL